MRVKSNHVCRIISNIFLSEPDLNKCASSIRLNTHLATSTVWNLKGPVTVPSCYFCRHKSPTLHSFPSLDQKRFISWWMLLPATHRDCSCLLTMYGTVQMSKASKKHCSMSTEYHLSHKFDTRHLLKIRSCAPLRRPHGIEVVVLWWWGWLCSVTFGFSPDCLLCLVSLNM